jgi:putative ABC transport system substrate-binding protein
VGLLFEPTNPQSTLQVKEVERAGARLKIRITTMPLQQPADIDQAFAKGAAAGVQAYIVPGGFFMNTHRRAIIDGIARQKVPAIYGFTLFAEGGGLMAYAASLTDNFRRAAVYADKILKGAKPGELPIEQPAKFELIVNLKTAKALRVTIPKLLLFQADKVIE